MENAETQPEVVPPVDPGDLLAQLEQEVSGEKAGVALKLFRVLRAELDAREKSGELEVFAKHLSSKELVAQLRGLIGVLKNQGVTVNLNAGRVPIAHDKRKLIENSSLLRTDHARKVAWTLADKALDQEKPS